MSNKRSVLKMESKEFLFNMKKYQGWPDDQQTAQIRKSKGPNNKVVLTPLN